MSDPDTQNIPGADAAMHGYSTAAKQLQSFANEMQRMSKDSMTASQQLMEKLRSAKTVEEVVALQSGFMQQSFQNYSEYTKRLGELMMAMPMELAKQSQALFQQGTQAMSKATEQAGDQIKKAGDEFNQSHG